jgi:outer membrane protein assembly factor BamB
MRTVALLAGLLLSSAVGTAQPSPAAGDWFQWRGPGRDGKSPDTGLLQQWPSGGPPRVWSVNSLGTGYGSLAIARDRIFVQGSGGERGRQSVLYVLNRADGRSLWSKALGPSVNNDRGGGPRGTPTVDGDRVYVLSENGDLACLSVRDGTSMWQRNILREFGGRQIPWLVSESPLVDGNHVIVTPGGSKGGMVALDKMTGRTVWTAALDDDAGYASPIAADVDGVRTIMTFMSGAAVGVRASDGRVMWRYRNVANGTANIATPVFADNQVFFTSGYDTGAVLLTLTAAGGEVRAKEAYFTRNLQNHHGGVVLIDGYVYGFHDSILTCLELATGKVMWRHRSVGKGALAYADGHLYIVAENLTVALAEASSTGYREKGRFRLEDKGLPTWAHPAISGGHLYIRNQEALSAYDVRAR